MEGNLKVRGSKSGKGVFGKVNVCKMCYKTFLSNRSTAMYCGNTCKVKSYRKRLNEVLINEIKLRYGI